MDLDEITSPGTLDDVSYELRQIQLQIGEQTEDTKNQSLYLGAILSGLGLLETWIGVGVIVVIILLSLILWRVW